MNLDTIFKQFYFAKKNTEYWKDKHIDIHKFPIMSKSELRSIDPEKLFPPNQTVHRTFNTSGTTGKPTTALWTESDWNLVVESISLQLSIRLPSHVKTIINAYSMTHLSGNLYCAVFNRLGYKVIQLEDYLRVADISDGAGLIINYNSISNKVKVGLKELIATNPNFIHENKIKFMIMSSSALPLEIKNSLNLDIISLYGCSEMGYLGYSCKINSKLFHLFNGYVETEILKNLDEHVSIDERGHVVVTRLQNYSSQFLRLDVQDTATYKGEKLCDCGFVGKTLTNIERA
jgi:phenylacetate-coenzyme A ligase PaaK-like adenylate-forming protein